MITTTLPISNLHCISCSLVIEESLADKGVHARINYVKQTITFTFNEGKITIADIKDSIHKLGYHV